MSALPFLTFFLLLCHCGTVLASADAEHVFNYTNVSRQLQATAGRRAQAQVEGGDLEHWCDVWCPSGSAPARTTQIAQEASPVQSQSTTSKSTKSTKSKTVSCTRVKRSSGKCKPSQIRMFGKSGQLTACCTSGVEAQEDAESEIDALVEEQEEELEEQVQQVDIAISIMLLGSVTIVMSLFYLVNNDDQDIKEYSWQVISSTLAIFTSVLMFEATNGISDKLMEDAGCHHFGEGFVVFLKYCQVLMWFVILQIVLEKISFAETMTPPVDLTRSNSSYGASVYFSEGISNEDPEKVLMIKCWGTLLAHMTGFAAIHAGGELQHLEIFASSPAVAMLSVLVTVAILLCVFWTSNNLRENRGDAAEVQMWDRETEEAENDIASLVLSFLLVQALRFQLGGNLPDVKGLEPHNVIHDFGFICSLLTCSAVCAALSVALLLISTEGRAVIVAQATSSMSFAWCIFYASKIGIGKFVWNVSGDPTIDLNGVCMRVVLASCLSCCSLALIFVLDAVEDLDFTGDSADKAIKSMIHAIGILVGFSWEQVFEGGVEVIAEVTLERGVWYPIMTKFLLATLLAGGIIPAWRRHILRNTCHDVLVQQQKQQRRAQRKKTRRNTLRSMTSMTGLYTAVPTEGTEMDLQPEE